MCYSMMSAKLYFVVLLRYKHFSVTIARAFCGRRMYAFFSCRLGVIGLLASSLLLSANAAPSKANENSCTTSLLVNFDSAKKVGATLVQRSSSVSASGNTPLAMAISAAAADLAPESSQEKIIVVLSDGEETCGGDPVAAALAAKAAQVRLTTNIVGLSVSETAAQQLEKIASATGGRYISAERLDELQCKLRQALDGLPKSPLDKYHQFIDQRRNALEDPKLADTDVARLEMEVLDRMEQLIEDEEFRSLVGTPEVAYARIKGEVKLARVERPARPGATRSILGRETTEGAPRNTKPSSPAQYSRLHNDNGELPCEVAEPEYVPSRSIILVLDISQSMSTRIAGAKEAITSFISTLRPKTRVALRTFGGNPTAYQTAEDDCADKDIIGVEAKVDGRKSVIHNVADDIFFDVKTEYKNCSTLDIYWDFGDGNISNERSPIHRYNKTGTYKPTVRVACDGRCDETKDTTSVIIPSVLSLAITNGGATQNNVSGKNNWVAVRDASKYIVVEATTEPNIEEVWQKIQWSGDTGDAVPGRANQRQLSRSLSRKYHVEAALSNKINHVDVWVIWAYVTIKMKGYPSTNSAQFVDVTLRDGTNTLGAVTYPSLVSTILDGEYVTNYGASAKVAPEAIISPAGIHEFVKSGWVFKREHWTHSWFDNGVRNKPGNDRYSFWNTTWVDDTSLADVLRLTPDAHDKLYDLDAPDIRHTAKNTEMYHNFRQWIEWNGYRCSDYAEWYWQVRWQASKDPKRQILLNDLGEGNKDLPETPYFGQ